MTELTRLGRYELRRVLGKGAMGVVYEGFDPTLHRRVAVKTILKSVAIDAETAASYSARFIREAQAVARLNHPHIVQVHDFGEQNEVAYLVMEFIEGRELRMAFDAGESFDAAEVVRIMGELLDALDFAHERGVIHRDVKPANVMLDPQRRVKLADFGVARVQDSDRSVAGTMVGTPAFMSPEQIKGAKVDRRTDIFSAGVVLYQLLTGEQPFKGEGAWTVAKKIVEDNPPLPSTVVTSVSPAFDAVVNKALAKLPPQRFGSAKEFAAALRNLKPDAPRADAPAVIAAQTRAETKASETELEFWRSIQNRDDLDELELYLEQFPNGVYAQLARLKIAKLRQPIEAARREAEEKAKREAEETARQEAAAKAKREAEEKARREAEAIAKREAEEEARRESEEKARREAVDKARRDTAEKARREAEEHARREAAERAQREAAERVRKEAEDRIRKEAEAKRAAEEKARGEAEEKKRQAEALARLKAQEAARAKVAVADEDATVAMKSRTEKKSLGFPVVLAVVIVVGGAIAYLWMKRTPAPLSVVEKPAPPRAETPSVDAAKIRREAEERARQVAEKLNAEKQAAAKVAAEKAAADKLAADKATMEKAAADKLATEKAAAEKAAAAKLAAEKAMAEKAVAEKAAAERAAAERLAAEKVAAEKAAAEKQAAEKAAAEKVAAEKAAAAKAAAPKTGWPSVGDRWLYEVRDADHSDRAYQASFEIKAMDSTSISEIVRLRGTGGKEFRHSAGLYMFDVAPGVVSFSPYLRAFRELRAGTRWTDIDIKRLAQECGEFGVQWTTCNVTSARVEGNDQVTTKAGRFDTRKIRVEIAAYVAGIGTGRFGYTGNRVLTYVYWYSDEMKRAVKYQFRATGGVWPDPDIDMELVSYTQAGGTK